MQPNNDIPNKIDSLTKKLYSRTAKITPQRFGVLHSDTVKVNDSWKDEEIVDTVKDTPALIEYQSRSLFKTFFIIAVFFFIIALGFVGYTFLVGGNKVSGDNISINVIGNSFTPGGEELPLEVEIANQNAVPLELSDLIIEYPKTGSEITNASDLVRTRRSVGTIAPGKIARQKLGLLLVGEEGSTKQVKLTLEYRVSGSTVSFRKDRIFPVKISSAPIVLTLDAPTQATSGQNYITRITVGTNTTKSIPNMLLKVDYPIGFSVKETKPKPDLFNNVWTLGTVEPGKPKTIELSGILQAEDGEDRSIRVYVGEPAKDNPQAIGAVYASKLVTAHMTRPAVDAKLFVNGSNEKEIITQSKSTIQGQVIWSNNLTNSVTDMEILLKLGGVLIDKSTVQAFGGYYNSADNTILWNKNTNEELAQVDPGKTGTFSFSFGTVGLYSKGQISTGTPEVNLDVSILAKEPIEGGGVRKALSSDTKKIRFSTDFQVTTTPSYYNGPFTNSGALPPKASQKTTYTIKWTLTNTANPVRDAEVRALLPINVHMVNAPSPNTANISRDDRTGEIVWKAGDVSRGAGFGIDPKTVYFQVELLPSITDIGTSPILIKETKAIGVDTVTGASLSAKWAQQTIKLYNDQNYSPSTEKVVE